MLSNSCPPSSCNTRQLIASWNTSIQASLTVGTPFKESTVAGGNRIPDKDGRQGSVSSKAEEALSQHTEPLSHSSNERGADLPQLLTGYWYSSCSWASTHSSRSSQRCRSLRLYFMVSLPSFLCDDSSPGFSGVWKVTRGCVLEFLAILTASSSSSSSSPPAGTHLPVGCSPLSLNQYLPAARGSGHKLLTDTKGRQHQRCQGARWGTARSWGSVRAQALGFHNQHC